MIDVYGFWDLFIGAVTGVAVGYFGAPTWVAITVGVTLYLLSRIDTRLIMIGAKR